MPGAGKTTVAKILSKKLKLKHYYAGQMWRDIAKNKGTCVDDLLKKAEQDSTIDKQIDSTFIKLAKTGDNFIAEGRTAAHFIPDAINIFITVDPIIGAQRIFSDLQNKEKRMQRNEKTANSVEETSKNLKKRIQTDKKRYMQLYGIDVFAPENYDVCIDTTEDDIDTVVKKIEEFLSQYLSDQLNK